MDKQPLVVFVFSKEGSSTSPRYGGFAGRIQKQGGLSGFRVLTVALENLVFIINEDKTAEVIDPVSKQALSGADYVYFKSWSAFPDEASAFANFLTGRGIQFADTAVLGVGKSKITTAMQLWAASVPMPTTVYSRRSRHLTDYLKSSLGKKFIVKDVNGEKGRLNFYTTLPEAKKILSKHPDKQFICQRFVPNVGDYRIGVYMSKAGFVILRKGIEGTHLNNTSAGGTATYIPIKKAPKAVIKLAEQAAKASGMQIAGVDVIVDQQTQKPMALEVNQGSQIVTGAFVDKNIEAFNSAMSSVIRKRHAKSRQQPLSIVGRRTIVKLPELGVAGAIAKIDTGAYSSTLHAENIRLEEGSGGKVLAFDIATNDGYMSGEGKLHTVRVQDFFVQKVRSSNGQLQNRYSIRTRLALGGKVIKAVLTLSDRSEMGYPLLIGRRVIRSRFLVNVELNEENIRTWSF